VLRPQTSPGSRWPGSCCIRESFSRQRRVNHIERGARAKKGTARSCSDFSACRRIRVPKPEHAPRSDATSEPAGCLAATQPARAHVTKQQQRQVPRPRGSAWPPAPLVGSLGPSVLRPAACSLPCGFSCAAPDRSSGIFALARGLLLRPLAAAGANDVSTIQRAHRQG
jgi:hypothetical protein